MRTSFVRFAALALLSVSAAGASAADLFNGRNLDGWEFVSPTPAAIDTVVKLLPDGVLAATGQPSGFIATTATYENFKLHAEWRWSGKPGNGGVLLHISEGPKDGPWPLSQQIQTKHKSVGDVLPMAGASFFEPLTSAPGAKPPIKAFTGTDSENAVGAWNSCDIVSRNGVIEVAINGMPQNRVTQSKPMRGRVGFQFEGTPFELRNVTLTPLD